MWGAVLHNLAATAPGQGVGGTGDGPVGQELLHLKIMQLHYSQAWLEI